MDILTEAHVVADDEARHKVLLVLAFTNRITAYGTCHIATSVP